MNKQRRLEDSELWQLASTIAEQCYGLLDNFPEEEKWGMQSKLRARAFEMTSDIAEAIGAIDPRDIKWQFGLARRDVFGLKNIICLAYKTAYLAALPDLMVQIDRLTELIDRAIVTATDEIPQWFKEMQPPVKGGKK